MPEDKLVRARDPIPAAGGFNFWCAVGLYSFAALGPVVSHYVDRAFRPDENWAGTTPFDGYFGPGLMAHGAGALCAYLLVRRDARAQWLAIYLAAWVSLSLVGWLWWWLRHRESFSWVYLGAEGFAVLLYVVQARYVMALHRLGSLR